MFVSSARSDRIFASGAKYIRRINQRKWIWRERRGAHFAKQETAAVFESAKIRNFVGAFRDKYVELHGQIHDCRRARRS